MLCRCDNECIDFGDCCFDWARKFHNKTESLNILRTRHQCTKWVNNVRSRILASFPDSTCFALETCRQSKTLVCIKTLKQGQSKQALPPPNSKGKAYTELNVHSKTLLRIGIGKRRRRRSRQQKKQGLH